MNQLTPEIIQKKLKTGLLGRNIYCFNQITSTNDFAKKLLEQNAPEGTLIIAEYQTQGRGRLGRSWLAPPGKALLFSLILKPETPMKKIGLVSLLASIAVAEAMESLVNVKPALKWPNDILLNNKKICGILLETVTNNFSDLCSFIILGVGINLTQQVEDFPKDIKATATSLLIETGQKIDRLNLLSTILSILEDKYLRFKNGEDTFIGQEWLQYCPFVNQSIYIKMNHDELRGIFAGLDQNGSLLLKDAANNIRKISYGEIIKCEKQPW